MLGAAFEFGNMIIGILSDAHGNLLAFEQCLRCIESKKIDQLYFLGDSVGYYQDGNSILSLIEQFEMKCVLGNHEAMLLGYIELDERKDNIYKLQAQRESISSVNLEMIKKWPKKIEIVQDGKRMLFVHASPWDNYQEYVYPDSDYSKFDELSYDYIFMGHTHIPMIRKTKMATIINVGSCGMPRDKGNSGSFAIIDTETGDVSIIRLNLNIAATIKKYEGVVHPTVINCLFRDK